MYNLDLIRGVRPLRVFHRFSNKYFFQKKLFTQNISGYVIMKTHISLKCLMMTFGKDQ